MNDVRSLIDDALQRYRGIRRKRAGLAACGAFALIMVTAALLDRIWMFSEGARWSAWGAALAAAAWVARRAAGPSCPDATSLAHRVESDAGETAPVVATAIDPAVRQSAGSDPIARSLLDRLDVRAAKAIEVAPPTFRGMLQGPAAFAAVASAMLPALIALQGHQGLQRVFFPWQPSPYTRLRLEGPAEPMAEGQAFNVTVQVLGVPVENVRLYRLGEPVPVAESRPDKHGIVRLTLEGLDGPTQFVARAGDGQSRPLQIEPYLLPRIEAFEIHVTPPTYVASAAATEVAPSFSVLRSSRMRYRLHLRAPAVAIAVERSAVPHVDERVTDEERATLKRGAYGVSVGPEESDIPSSRGPVFHPDPSDPLIWEADWDLPDPEDIVYRLAIEGKQGDQVRNDEPWRINVIADAPPKVRIHGHNGDEVLKVGDETVRFGLSALDDVGLAEARMVFRKPGQPHTRQEIDLPTDTGRTWSGAELLDLAPLELSMYDIVAVHVEAQDGNTVDGPGLGRSDMVYLEIPPPEADDPDGGSGGGGGAGGPPPINPLELQMEILRSTIALPADVPTREQEAIAHDQRQNADYTRQLEEAVCAAGLGDLADALRLAWMSMGDAGRLLDTQVAENAIPDEEAALGHLITASKLLDEAADQLPPVSAEGEPQLTFTLRPPRAGSSSEQQNDDDAAGREKELRELMDAIRKQLAEQEQLNRTPGANGQLAESQQSLAGEARSAAGEARGLSASSSDRGDPVAAAEELERAAALQEDNAEALAAGDGAASEQLGSQSAEALAEALRALAPRLDGDAIDSGAAVPGYERLISDYLRSISYE